MNKKRICICSIAFFIITALALPVYGEVDTDAFIDAYLDAIDVKDQGRIVKLIQDNPSTTQKVIKYFESEAVSANSEQAKAANTLASILKQIYGLVAKQGDDIEFAKAYSLFEEGLQLYNVSDYRGTIKKWETALPIFEKLGERTVVGEITGNLGGVYSSLGEYSRAIVYYEKALVIAEATGNKKGKGGILGNLGVAYKNLGNYREAKSYYEKSLAIAEELGNKEGKSTNLVNLGTVYSNLGEYRRAISNYEQALGIAEDIKDKIGIASCLNNLGTVYNYWGDYKRAITFHEKALAIAEEIGKKDSVGTNLGNLGLVYSQLGDNQAAITYYEDSLAIAEEIGDKKGIITNNGNLGNVYKRMGDYRKAIKLYEKSLSVSEETGDKKGSSAALGNLAAVYSMLGDHSKAMELNEKAITIAETIGDKRSKSTYINNLGSLFKKIGEYHKAISFFENAIEINKGMGIAYEIPEMNLADTYLDLDRDDEALSIYIKHDHPVRLGRYYLKHKLFTKAQEQFDRGREIHEQQKAVYMIIPKWIGLGLSLEGLKEYDKAYGWYKKAIDIMEEQRETLAPAEREHFFEVNEFGIPRIEAYEGAVRCAFMLGRYEDAFYWAENTRGRVLSELLSRRHGGETFKLPSNLAKEEDEITSLVSINKKQQQTAFEKSNDELLKQVEAEYPALKQKMDNLIDRLRKDYPQYAAIKYPQPVKLSQLTLGNGVTLIEYEVTDPYTVGLVIRDGKVIKAFKVNKTRRELETLVKKFRAPFQEGASLKDFSFNLSKDLNDLLLKPALPELKKGEHVIIIPDESLSLLPFEALLLAAPHQALQDEALLLAQNAKQAINGTIDKNTIIRGLTQIPPTRSGSISVAPRISTHILFETDSAQIRPESAKQIREIAAALISPELRNTNVQIEGHTDNVGNPKYNLRLSFKRAQSVYDALIKSGIEPKRLTFTGKGDTAPVADNKADEGRRLNRRVDFVRVDSYRQQQASATSVSSSMNRQFVYLADEYPVSYYQSASVLSLQRSLNIKRAQDKVFFGLGDPIFDKGDGRIADKRAIQIVAKQKDAPLEIADNEETKDAGYHFSRLVNTAKEVSEVGKLFNNSKLFLGNEATEAKLKAEDLTARRYVLLSTHGILGNEIPYIKQPALVLGLVDNDQEDGFLTASEIFNLNMNADIVGLSACKTGLGVQSAGEGVVGLTRAFMYAGTDTVLVSLWSVSDESTYKLMVSFFGGLKQGKGKLTAMREARNYLRSNGYDHPFYWAPFILVGEAN